MANFALQLKNITKAYGDVATRFEAANPDVDIEMIYAPHDAYNEKFSAAVMAKQLPDIMELDAPFLANYVWSGYLQPVKPLIDKDLLDDMTDSNIAQGTYPIDKDLYAIGLTDSSVGTTSVRYPLNSARTPSRYRPVRASECTQPTMRDWAFAISFLVKKSSGFTRSTG